MENIQVARVNFICRPGGSVNKIKLIKFFGFFELSMPLKSIHVSITKEYWRRAANEVFRFLPKLGKIISKRLFEYEF